LAEDVTDVPARELVNSVLQIVDRDSSSSDVAAGTVPPAETERLDSLLLALSQIGKRQQPRPLHDPLLFGNYRVSYVSSRGSPAGGPIVTSPRSRRVFRSKGLYQAIARGRLGHPSIVVNKVVASLFGFLTFSIALRGLVCRPSLETLTALEDEADTVKVVFDPARLLLPGGIEVRVGRPSSVTLQTVYLDERLRLGRGKYGATFVFKRDAAADWEDMESLGREPVPAASQAAGIAVTAALAGLGALCLVGLWGVGPLALLPLGQVGPVRAALAPAVRLLGFVVGLVAAGLLRAMVQAAMVPDVAVDSAQKEAGAPEPVAEGA